MVKHHVFDHFQSVGHRLYKCCFCSTTLSCDDQERALKHIVQRCTAPPPSVKIAMQLEYDRLYPQRVQSISSSQGSDGRSTSSNSSQQSSWFDNQFDKLTRSEKSNLDQDLAETFFELGMPFNLLNHPKFRNFVKALRPAYNPPYRRDLAGPLLDQAFSQQQAGLQQSIDRAARLTLVTDGWTNIRNESIINYMLVDPEGKAYFYKADPTGIAAHTSAYLAEELNKVIEDVGPEKIIALCTDNAPNMKLAARMVKAKYPHIHAIGCNSHMLNLAIKDVLNIDELKTPLQEAIEVVKWFKSHHRPLAYLREKQKEQHGKEISLALPVVTRWQSNSDCLQSLKASRAALEQTVMLPEVREIMLSSNGGAVRGSILSDQWWKAIDMVLDIVQPFLRVIIRLESNQPRLSSIHRSYTWLANQAVQDAPEAVKEAISEALDRRWNSISCAQMLLASVFDVCGGDPPQILTAGELNYVLSWLKKYYASDINKANRMYAQLASFNVRDQPYNNNTIWDEGVRRSFTSLLWWKVHHHDELSDLAQDILSIQPTSGAAERNWSTFGFIHTKSRNRLLNTRVNKLVHIYTNARLMQKDSHQVAALFDDDDDDGNDGNDAGLLDMQVDLQGSSV